MAASLIRQAVNSFNPRPCRRGDLDDYDDAELVRKFQSTPLQEGRRGRLR